MSNPRYVVLGTTLAAVPVEMDGGPGQPSRLEQVQAQPGEGLIQVLAPKWEEGMLDEVYQRLNAPRVSAGPLDVSVTGTEQEQQIARVLIHLKQNLEDDGQLDAEEMQQLLSDLAGLATQFIDPAQFAGAAIKHIMGLFGGRK